MRHVLREYDQPTTTTTSMIRRDRTSSTGAEGETRTETTTEAVTTVTRTPYESRPGRVQPEQRGDRTRREWRNYVVRIYLAAINANYLEFAGQVSGERRQVGLGTDAVINGFTTYATVARTSIVSELSAAAAGFAGLRGAIDRNLYAEQTNSALRASMDAQRARILAQIENGLRQNEDAYSLSDAFGHLQQLEEAGSLDVAVGEITRTAAEQRDIARQELATAVQVCEVVDESATDLTDRLARFVHELATGSPVAPDTAVARTQSLQQVGRLAGLPSDLLISATPDQISTLIRRRLVAGVEGRCAAANYESLIDRIELETGRTVP